MCLSDKVRGFADLKPGWDGEIKYESPVPSELAIKNALEFLALDTNGIIHGASPDVMGGVCLSYYTKEKTYSIDFNNDGCNVSIAQINRVTIRLIEFTDIGEEVNYLKEFVLL